MPLAQPLNEILDLYRRSFPPGERRADSEIGESIASSDYRTITKMIVGKLAGFALLFMPYGETFALLEYLAVEPALHARGIGSQLLRESVDAAAGRHVLFEVESESLGDTAKRRQQFYLSFGCHRIDRLRYLLPLPNDPPPMDLMIYPAEFVETQTLKRWLTRIYNDVYRCRADDPRLMQMISDLRA